MQSLHSMMGGEGEEQDEMGDMQRGYDKGAQQQKSSQGMPVEKVFGE